VDVTLKTRFSTSEVNFDYTTPITTGESSLASPLTNATIVNVDADKILDMTGASVAVTVVSGDHTITIRFPDDENKDLKRKPVILPPKTNRFGIKAYLKLEDTYPGTLIYNDTTNVALSGDDFGRLIRIDAKKLMEGDKDNYAEFVIEGGGEEIELEFEGGDDKSTWRKYVVLPASAKSYAISVEAEVKGEDYEGEFEFTDDTKHRFRIKGDQLVD